MPGRSFAGAGSVFALKVWTELSVRCWLPTDGADVFKNVTTAAQRGLGPVYATGISGQWVWCRNTSMPATCVFDDKARSTIDWMLDELGSNKVAHWVDEATSQVTWDAWGYYLHRA
jgi:pyruvate-formate lyase-activating enzyme